jgi:hypothetical protein
MCSYNNPREECHDIQIKTDKKHFNKVMMDRIKINSLPMGGSQNCAWRDNTSATQPFSEKKTSNEGHLKYFEVVCAMKIIFHCHT